MLLSSVITDEEIKVRRTLGTYLLLQLIQKMQKTLMMRYKYTWRQYWSRYTYCWCVALYKEGTDLEEEAAKEQHQFI
jgi:hypothetical protein